MTFTQLRVGGVPEHFNLPWHLAMERKQFEKNDLHILWRDYPGGTGAMCADLRNGELDVAMVLTEGITADIINGNPSRILQWYVTTPLYWGIHVAAGSPYEKMDDVKGKRYAISRMGSGSHLMAHVDAKMRGWTLQDEQFVVVNNVDGAREALKNNQAEIFLWEKFTTKPLVDAGEFRKIDERPTPWPCFVIAASEKALAKQKDAIQLMQKIISKQCDAFMDEYNALAIISQRYNLLEKDVKQWMRITSWACDNEIHAGTLHQVVDSLLDLKIINKKVQANELCSDLCKLK